MLKTFSNKLENSQFLIARLDKFYDIYSHKFVGGQSVEKVFHFAAENISNSSLF